jgi:hypothetical protein
MYVLVVPGDEGVGKLAEPVVLTTTGLALPPLQPAAPNRTSNAADPARLIRLAAIFLWGFARICLSITLRLVKT